MKYLAMDFVMTSLAFLSINICRYYLIVRKMWTGITLTDFLCYDKLLAEQLLVPVGLMGIYWLSGYYNKPFYKSRVAEFNQTLWSVIAATALIFLIFLINDATGIKSRDYELILLVFGLLMVFVYTGRCILTNLTIRHLKRRHWIYSTLIIGNSRRSRDVYEKLKASGSVWAYDVVGFVRIEREHQVEDGMPTWDWEEIEKVCDKYDIDQIILAPERIRDSQIIKILSRLFPLNKPVRIAPDTLSYVTGNIHLNDILGIPFIDLTSPRMSDFNNNLKRTFDVVISALVLILMSPLYLLAAIIVRTTSEGPAIYSQERIGKGRKPFRIYKFRSMRIDAEKDGPKLSSDNDPRITPFGRVMRKYRLDEFPQFWNVLKGDMSLVGPRPEREYYIRRIVKHAPYYGLIFQVRPGITSWGMVKFGYASNVGEMVARSRYDLLYINNMSVSTDIKILIHTVVTVVRGSGK